MQKKAIVAAAVIILASCCKAPLLPCAAVTEQTIICGSDILVEDIRIPIISNIADKEFQDSLNADILAIVEKARKEARQDAKMVQQWSQYVCVLVVDYELKNSCGLFSMRLTTDLDNGGTGMPNTHYFNVDLKKNVMLCLDELFSSQLYRKVIDRFILETISKDARFSPRDFPGVADDTAFFINEERLHIAFAKYEISSGTTGEPVFSIPSSIIQKYLKPDYSAFFIS